MGPPLLATSSSVYLSCSGLRLKVTIRLIGASLTLLNQYSCSELASVKARSAASPSSSTPPANPPALSLATPASSTMPIPMSSIFHRKFSWVLTTSSDFPPPTATAIWSTVTTGSSIAPVHFTTACKKGWRRFPQLILVGKSPLRPSTFSPSTVSRTRLFLNSCPFRCPLTAPRSSTLKMTRLSTLSPVKNIEATGISSRKLVRASSTAPFGSDLPFFF
mmetsp:Transcript_11373/g.23038  ORF Transcript_11373/g.23038 Transcript_11373/m.23038 type:complete len:219 (-) Transcript_11373:249-905(-)